MEQQHTMLQQVAALAQTATRAASAAEKALSNIGESRSSDGPQAASRILKSPDTFDGTDILGFMSRKQQFSSWLSFGDNRFSDKLERIEKLTSAPSITSYTDEDKEMARKLHCSVRILPQRKVSSDGKIVFKHQRWILIVVSDDAGIPSVHKI